MTPKPMCCIEETWYAKLEKHITLSIIVWRRMMISWPKRSFEWKWIWNFTGVDRLRRASRWAKVILLVRCETLTQLLRARLGLVLPPGNESKVKVGLWLVMKVLVQSKEARIEHELFNYYYWRKTTNENGKIDRGNYASKLLSR